MVSRPAAALLVVLLPILYHAGLAQGAISCNETVMSTQISALLALYDRDASPAPTVKVATKFELRHGIIDEKTKMFHILAEFWMFWNDSRLAWNATDNGCSFVMVDEEQLWVPDVELVNAAADHAGAERLTARVSSTGKVSSVARLDVLLPVALQLDDWPNDVQSGEFSFASRAHSLKEIVLTDMDTRNGVLDTGIWDLLNVVGYKSTLPGVVEGDEKRSVHLYQVNLRRLAPSQALTARMVLTCALLLLGAAALLPPPGRAPLAATAALIVAIWLCTAVWNLPGGKRPPRAVCVQGAVCAAAGATALAAVLVTRIGRLSSPPPQLVRNLVFTASKVIPFSAPPEGSVGESSTWAAAARALDAALLVVLGVVLFVLLCVYI